MPTPELFMERHIGGEATLALASGASHMAKEETIGYRHGPASSKELFNVARTTQTKRHRETMATDDLLEPPKCRASRRGRPPTFGELVFVKDSPDMGKGLFARVDMMRDTVVAVIPDPQRVGDESFAEDKGLPHDAIVWKGCDGFFDRRFVQREWPPLWYRMNHSKRNANVSMRIDKSKNTVQWVTTEEVGEGVELKYKYGFAPEEWD